jgi:hypothetical protein
MKTTTRHNKSTTKSTQEEQPSNFLSETCHYCGRVRWGNWQYLLGGEWRHEECYPGSRDWCEYYERLPESDRTPEQRHLYEWAKGGRPK